MLPGTGVRSATALGAESGGQRKLAAGAAGQDALLARAPGGDGGASGFLVG
nr:hypothetical protein [uncultured Pseudomonas sp.]